ncbi:MAG TPA: luciferase family protein [Terriglobales bacterium]|nr:luciferase family protein [Terriglobales bacterium]
MDEISTWPGVSVAPHRFGGKEFLFADAEVGHIHPGGVLDIPFPRSVRNELLSQRLAEPHHWLPTSGWITFHIQSDDDLRQALWLLRLSYLRYSLKVSPDPRATFEDESERLQLAAQFRQLFEKFIPAPATAQSAA